MAAIVCPATRWPNHGRMNVTTYEIDVDPQEALEFLARWPKGGAPPVNSPVAKLLLAIRANPPKPPRMAEPDWGEKVWAEGREWLRDYNPDYEDTSRGTFRVYRWVTEDGTRRSWDDLTDPVPM